MTLRIEPVRGPIVDILHAISDELPTKQFEDIMRACQLLSGEMWVAYIDDALACCWSVVPPTIFSQQAYLWLYHTDKFAEHKFILVRKSQIVIEVMLERYPILIGHCKVGADSSIRWLRWLGAVFGEPIADAIPFTIRKRQHG